MFVINDTFHHLKELKKSCEQYSVDASFDLFTFEVTLTYKNERCKLFPQFFSIADEVRHYSHEFSNTALHFIGWQPYKPYKVPLFSDKVRFKEALMKLNIKTPRYSEDSGSALSDVLIKDRASSFSQNIKGPFRFLNNEISGEYKNEFYEKFVFGRNLKVWYWNDQLVVSELSEMPRIIGDGQNTIMQLMKTYYPRLSEKDYGSTFECMLAYQNKETDNILDLGEELVVDFRYGSLLCRAEKRHEIIYTNYEGSSFKPELEEIGEKVWQLLSQYHDNINLAYTMDFILCYDNKLYVLEANSNPTIHPGLYNEMIFSIFFS